MSNTHILEEVKGISSDIRGQINLAIISTHFVLDIVENPPVDGLSSETGALKEFLSSILLSLETAHKNCAEIIELTNQS
jgi:hypothetical protein